MPTRGCRRPRKKSSSTTPAERARPSRSATGRAAIQGIAAGGDLGSSSSPPSPLTRSATTTRPQSTANQAPMPKSSPIAISRPARPTQAELLRERADAAGRRAGEARSPPGDDRADEQRVHQEELPGRDRRELDLGRDAELRERREDPQPEDQGDPQETCGAPQRRREARRVESALPRAQVEQQRRRHGEERRQRGSRELAQRRAQACGGRFFAPALAPPGLPGPPDAPACVGGGAGRRRIW